jgi:chemotaxis protein CheD
VADVMVRMAEFAASQHPGDVLVSLGLGSCIGVALLDDSRRVAALAHVVLPSSADAPSSAGNAAKFADTAVPLLIDEVTSMGVPRSRIWAVTVGGAQMFTLGGAKLDIGRRNDVGVKDALDSARIPVRATVTGGSVGRTVRVYVGEGRVTCKEAGGPELDVIGGLLGLAQAA